MSCVCLRRKYISTEEEKGNFASSKGNTHTPFSCILHSNNDLSCTGEKNNKNNKVKIRINLNI